MLFNDKVVIVTGGGTGIGKATWNIESAQKNNCELSWPLCKAPNY
ncbi:hypothetical protein [Planococcus salinarum]|nr:hypothetical protein [Planococcus salinarum]